MLTKKATGPGLAIAAVFSAAAVPILHPALEKVGASDFEQGLVMGVFLGLTILLLVLSLRAQRIGGK